MKLSLSIFWRDLKNGVSTWIIYLRWDGTSKIQEDWREEVECGDLFFFFSVKALKKWNKENVKGLLLARKACEHHWIDIQLFVQSQSGLG